MRTVSLHRVFKGINKTAISCTPIMLQRDNYNNPDSFGTLALDIAVARQPCFEQQIVQQEQVTLGLIPLQSAENSSI